MNRNESLQRQSQTDEGRGLGVASPLGPLYAWGKSNVTAQVMSRFRRRTKRLSNYSNEILCTKAPCSSYVWMLSTSNAAPKRDLNGRIERRGYAQRFADNDMNALCAEGEGFEPPRPVKGLPVFKTGAFNQALPPLRSGVVYSNIYSPRYVTGAQYAKFLPTDRPIFTDRKWVGS